MRTDFDVVILGSGFSAFEIAATASRDGKQVGIIEAGPMEPDQESASQSAVPFSREPVRSGGRAFGSKVPDGFETAPRCIALGGTSALWSGKWRCIDRVDLERNHGERQWPFKLDTLQPYVDRLLSDCAWPGLRLRESDDITDSCKREGLRQIDAWEESPPRRLRARWMDLDIRGEVTIRCNTSLVCPQFSADGRAIEAVRVRHGNTVERITAQTFIVACGGIESVYASHLLRWTGRTRQSQEPSWYGGFMDHPKAAIGHVHVTKNREAVESFLAENARTHRILALGLPEAELLETGIGNHTILLWPDGSPGARSLQMTLSLEQFPESANRILRDPKSLVAWRVSGDTWRNARNFLDLVLPRVEAVFGEASTRSTIRWTGASHHMGALPMGLPGVGVVDAQLRFHDVANLYCASTAVFPVAGSANPTLTAMALAQRLADHIGHLE